MSKFTKALRKYIGAISAAIGTILLIILTYGDMGELFTDKYWANVGGNITSIGALSIGLIMIQVFIKQGLCEQALSAGLNTDKTSGKFGEHKELLKKNREKSMYLPYFLSMRNKRETKIKKREFLSTNDFTSERALMVSGNKKLIREYKAIKVDITSSSIRWSTTDIVYNKNGRIEKLEEYRRNRAIKGVVSGIFFMFATTLIAGGLFLDAADIPFWQKTIKLFTYLISIAISVIPEVLKNYEKGAFSVPNELDEINNIWREFEAWQVPDWVEKEVEECLKSNDHMALLDEDVLKLPAPAIVQEEEIIVEEVKEDKTHERESTIDSRADVQEESVSSENL